MLRTIIFIRCVAPVEADPIAHLRRSCLRCTTWPLFPQRAPAQECGAVLALLAHGAGKFLEINQEKSRQS
jgi:hypothetical protein